MAEQLNLSNLKPAQARKERKRAAIAAAKKSAKKA